MCTPWQLQVNEHIPSYNIHHEQILLVKPSTHTYRTCTDRKPYLAVVLAVATVTVDDARRHHSRVIDECCPMTCALAAASRAVHDPQIRQPIRRNHRRSSKNEPIRQNPSRSSSKYDFAVLYSCEQCSPQSATPGNYCNFGRHALRPPRMFATRYRHKVMSDLIRCPLAFDYRHLE